MAKKFIHILALAVTCACATTKQATFDSPEQAMRALADAVATHDSDRAVEFFGEGGDDLLDSGDEVANREDGRRVRAAIEERLAFEDRDDTSKIALIGSDAWPFPIPLVLDDGRWRFDAEAGREELACRRIGRNELSTIATMHEYVDAQREYRMNSHDGRPPAYASRVISTPGKRDGLYWEVEEGESESPLGPLVGAAANEGYDVGHGGPIAYHGYYFRTLTGQGEHAPGGKKTYIDDQGHMTRGFALLAWPAKYANSGVMTFVVNQQGIVYQKDLGPQTEAAAAQITAFDPDASWSPTAD